MHNLYSYTYSMVGVDIPNQINKNIPVLNCIIMEVKFIATHMVTWYNNAAEDVSVNTTLYLPVFT